MGLGRSFVVNDTLRLAGLSGAQFAPATSAQHGLWLAYLFDETSTAYHVARAFRTIGALDVVATRAALGELSRGHEAMRTSFVVEDDDLYQVIWDSVEPDFPLHWINLSFHDSPSAVIRQECLTPLELSVAPLIRVTLFHHQDASFLTLVAHHMCQWTVHHLVRTRPVVRCGGPDDPISHNCAARTSNTPGA